MILERNRQTLCENVISNYGTLEDIDIAKKFGNELTSKIKTIKKLVENDYDNLTNSELYYLISEIYGIVLEEEDILRYISSKNNREYKSLRTIPTTMSITAEKKEGSGRTLDYWKQKFQVFLDIALAKDKIIITRDNFTKEVLKNLIEQKDIVVLDYDTLETDDVIYDEEEYDPNVIKCFKMSKRIIPNNEGEQEEFDFYMSILKEKLPRKKLLKELRNYMNELENEIYDLFMYSSMSYGYGPVSYECKKWYKNSNIKDDINVLSKKI